MPEGLNKALLIGNLGADPELRFTQNQRAVLKFRIATTESYATESGERREITHWHNVVMWGKRAEALSKILVKGTQVYIEGRIESRSYEDKDGVKRTATDINANNLILLGRRDGAGGATSGPSRGPAPARGPAAGGGASRSTPDEVPPGPEDFGGDSGGNDDDIPF